jgi:hypothetical protein
VTVTLTPAIDLAYMRADDSARLTQLFNDGAGNLDTAKVNQAINIATGQVAAYLLRSWPLATVNALLADPMIMHETGHLVLAIGMEGRPEFTNANGVNPWTGYLSKQAQQLLDNIANARARLSEEATVGKNAHVGGRVRHPTPPFEWAPRPGSNRGPGLY